MEKEELADYMIEKLNEFIKLDKSAMTRLTKTRVGCGENFANHPTIQVHERKIESSVSCEVGFLGMLNGMIGVIDTGPKIGYGLITAVFDEEGCLINFFRTDE